jgi:GT2 family glycosyltransferase
MLIAERPGSKAMDVAVVNYHTPGDLQRFMQTFSEHPPRPPWTLTVIDVETIPGAVLSEWHGGTLRRIGVEDNIGYGRACNLAATYATDDIIAMFNADVEVTPGSLDACGDALVEHDDWAILGPLQVDDRGHIRHAGIFGTLASPKHRGWNEINRGQYSEVRDAVTVSGSAFFAKRKVWDELTDCSIFREVAPEAEGAFLPTPHYYEETWASYHAQAHGHRVVYYGPVTMIHKWHRASVVGGWAEQQIPISRKMFRDACEGHGIPHD